MRIGIFSDDEGGMAAAGLIAHGLSGAGIPVDVEVEGVPTRFVEPWGGPSIGSVPAGGDDGADAVLVLPMSALREDDARDGLDVALTVGFGRPAAARALRAARYEVVGTDAPACPPPWFVPCSNQADLRTRATLAEGTRVRLPFATRAVPFMMPRVRVGRDGLPAVALQAGVLLASLAVAIAADPLARAVGAGSIASIMGGGDPGGPDKAASRLLRLSLAYERLDAVAARRPGGLPPARPTERRVLRASGEAWASGRSARPMPGRRAVG